MRSRNRALCFAFTAIAAVLPVRAADDTRPRAATPIQAAADNPFGTADPYQACVAAVDANAADAFEMASVWRDHGGGAPAERCIALALIALDEPGEAASRLDALARRMDTGTAADKARLLAQSGNAWLLASELENAEAAFSAALKLTPQDAEIWTDRARTRAARQDWANAEADLNSALTYDRSHPATYVLRASARQAQNNKAGYKADIDAALALDPTFPDALVERGAMKMDAGDAAGARADFLQVLLRAPDGPAADTVRKRIEVLEVHDR
jgi:tetratricopeptide (TPR) repeat protein